MAVEPISHDRVHARPKADGGVRWITELASDRDRRYRRLVAPFVPGIERSLGPGVVANRALDATPSLRDPASSRRRWRAVLERALGPGTVAIAGDVRECYGSIGRAAVRAGLARVGAVCPEELEAFLRSMPRGGLPVGPAPSAVLANAVLAVADDAVCRTGVAILRWVDDVVIVAPDRAAARAGFAAWRSTLATLGLVPNEAKTRPITGGPEVLRMLLGGPSSNASGTAHGIIRSR
jgi:hypothetical protein